MKPIVDPRQGDVEDDASSTKANSLLSMAGSLLGEISLAKLIVAWLILFIVPAVVLGLAPLIVSAWIAKLGATALIRTPNSAASIALHRVSAITPALAAA